MLFSTLLLAILGADLEPGPNAVGFQTIFVRDRTRPALVATDAGRGRLVPIHVWYPARASGAPLRYEHYIHLLGRLETDRRTSASDALGVERYLALARELSADATAPAEIDKIRALTTRATLDAPAQSGRFPLFVFPEYRAPARNVVMGEYLASHGIVVVSVPLIGSFDLDYDTGVSGVETTVTDIRIALNAIADRPFVDLTRVAIGGVGIAANIAVRYALQDPSVAAIVSLDGGLTSRFEDSLVKRSAFYDRGALRVPMLLVESPWEGMDRALLDQYRNAPRWFATFPRMREFHYLDYGALESEVPRIAGDPPADVKQGFPWAIRYVRAFLDQHLRG